MSPSFSKAWMRPNELLVFSSVIDCMVYFPVSSDNFRVRKGTKTPFSSSHHTKNTNRQSFFRLTDVDSLARRKSCASLTWLDVDIEGIVEGEVQKVAKILTPSKNAVPSHFKAELPKFISFRTCTAEQVLRFSPSFSNFAFLSDFLRIHTIYRFQKLHCWCDSFPCSSVSPCSRCAFLW